MKKIKNNEQEQKMHPRLARHHPHRMPDTRVIVKGYMRPDGTSYYVSIPKQIREIFKLKGGEYFLMKAYKEKQRISLIPVEFFIEDEENMTR